MKTLRWAAIILLFVLLGTLLIHDLDSINQDIGRHLKTGQIIWETKSVPKTNTFSFTEPDFPFINHHWLSEVVFFLLYGLIGLKGLIVFKALIILCAFLLLFKATDKEATTGSFLISGLASILVFSYRTDVRPEIFSYLFLAFFLFAILRAKYRKEYHWLYVLPFVQLLWTNMHIYFVIGPMLIFLLLADRWFYKESPVILKKIFWIFLATCATTLINPNFIRGALVPLNILKNYGYSIVENQSIFFLTDYGVSLKYINLFEISLVILILSFVIAFKKTSGHKKILFESLFIIVFSILAAKMIRNFGIYALAFVPIVSLNLSTIKSWAAINRQGFKILGYLASIILSLVMIYNVSHNSFYVWAGSSEKFGLAISVGSNKGVEFVKQNQIKGPVFNNFDVGSFLIWKLYPQQKVFVDGRPEAYGVDFFEKIYKPMQEDPILWKKYSDLYYINYVFFDYMDMTPWAQKFLADISQNPNWPLVYYDDSTIILVKRTPENREIIKKFTKH